MKRSSVVYVAKVFQHQAGDKQNTWDLWKRASHHAIGSLGKLYEWVSSYVKQRCYL
ncbi:hypothetical protein MTO96_052273, partial [Rhipicephalus appendiculatus]